MLTNGIKSGMKPHRYAFLSFLRVSAVTFLFAICGAGAFAQDSAPEAPKKANSRPADAAVSTREPFDGVAVEKMAGQCVTLETEVGSIEIEMMPEVAPESVRNFLNLAATGALDTTTFSRVVKGFVIQGRQSFHERKMGRRAFQASIAEAF
jgi:hypothetical protein